MKGRPTVFYPAPRTPVVESSAFGAGHKPLGSVQVDGRDVTREFAIFEVKLARQAAEKFLPIAQREDFVRQTLASANHDLLISGYRLISEGEIIDECNPLEAVAAPERVAALRAVLDKAHAEFFAGLLVP